MDILNLRDFQSPGPHEPSRATPAEALSAYRQHKAEVALGRRVARLLRQGLDQRQIASRMGLPLREVISLAAFYDLRDESEKPKAIPHPPGKETYVRNAILRGMPPRFIRRELEVTNAEYRRVYDRMLANGEIEPQAAGGWSYPQQYRDDCVAEVMAGESVPVVARRAGVDQVTLREWVKEAGGVPAKVEPEPELVPEAENSVLRWTAGWRAGSAQE